MAVIIIVVVVVVVIVGVLTLHIMSVAESSDTIHKSENVIGEYPGCEK